MPQNTIARRLGILAAMLSLPVSLGLTEPRKANADESEKARLAWIVPARECLYYRSIVRPVGNVNAEGQPPDPLLGDALPSPRRCRHVLLFGYEIDERGRRLPAFPVQDLEQAILQLCALSPKTASKAGAQWNDIWDFDASQALVPPRMSSSYELAEFADVEGHGRCARIKASHKLENASTAIAPLRWQSLQVRTNALFSIESNCVVRCDATISGLSNAQEKDGAPPTHDAVAWELAGRMDSTQVDQLDKLAEAALLRGLDYIWARRGKTGSWNPVFRPRGGTALALMTLLGCGIRADDPRIIEGFRALAGLPLEGTYEAAVSCMAYEALLVQRRNDTGDEKAVQTRDERAELDRVVKWLLEGRQTNDTWRYSPAPTGKPWFTTSIQEFTMRGLASAQRCGAEIPLSIARRSAQEVMARQAAEGEFIKRVTGGEYRKTGGVKVTRSGKAVQARGWTYERQVGTGDDANMAKAYESMTCAGINCLASSLELAQNAGKAAITEEFGGMEAFRKWKAEIEESVGGGLCWLDQNYMITQNRGEGYSQENAGQYYCFLHSLERACTFSETDWIGDHNWYDEGRAALLLCQEEDGHWARLIMWDAETVEDTCFAVLFLKKGILKPRFPVFTQREAE